MLFYIISLSWLYRLCLGILSSASRSFHSSLDFLWVIALFIEPVPSWVGHLNDSHAFAIPNTSGRADSSHFPPLQVYIQVTWEWASWFWCFISLKMFQLAYKVAGVPVTFSLMLSFSWPFSRFLPPSSPSSSTSSISPFTLQHMCSGTIPTLRFEAFFPLEAKSLCLLIFDQPQFWLLGYCFLYIQLLHHSLSPWLCLGSQSVHSHQHRGTCDILVHEDSPWAHQHLLCGTCVLDGWFCWLLL